MASKVEVLEGAIAEIKEKRRTAGAERTKQKKRLSAKSDDVRAEAQRLVDELEQQIAELDARAGTLQLECQFEQATQTLRNAYNAFLEGRERELDAGAGRADTERVIASRIRELEGLRSTVRLLSNRDKALTDLLRTYVGAHPHGWMRSDDPLKRYLAWFAPEGEGDLYAFLKDNPRYSITPEQLFALVGLASGTRFLSVSYSSLEKEVTQGLLSDTNGERVTLEQLHAVRSRSVNAPSVETRHREADKPVG
ncbi:MAG: hypothetical protein ABIG71_01920, partial [Candidatus Uhrbacteria bacterium]